MRVSARQRVLAACSHRPRMQRRETTRPRQQHSSADASQTVHAVRAVRGRRTHSHVRPEPPGSKPRWRPRFHDQGRRATQPLHYARLRRVRVDRVRARPMCATTRRAQRPCDRDRRRHTNLRGAQLRSRHRDSFGPNRSRHTRERIGSVAATDGLIAMDVATAIVQALQRVLRGCAGRSSYLYHCLRRWLHLQTVARDWHRLQQRQIARAPRGPSQNARNIHSPGGRRSGLRSNAMIDMPRVMDTA